MDALTIALRGIHFAAVIALFGDFVFRFFVVRRALREDVEPLRGERSALRRRSFRASAWSLAVAFGSGVGWLAVQAAAMSGLPFGDALNAQTVREVLDATLFGRVWKIRFALVLALGALLLLSRRTVNGRSAKVSDACGALLAGGLLATLAWAGHAATEQGADRAIHLSADAVHLLAAGAWLGALPPLVFVLGRARPGAADALEFAARVTRRFSLLGLSSVATLVLTGVVNSWYTVGGLAALFGTDYGRLLLVKLMLFGAMVSLAAVNRVSLMPGDSSSPGGYGDGSVVQALRQLRRNAIAETALGIAVVGIVGALGVSIPALHVQPVWPFSFTLDWRTVEVSNRAIAVISVALTAAVAALALVLFGIANGRRSTTAAGVAGMLAALAVCAWLLTVPAHPTTYFRSPIRYTADAITRGAALYAQNCAVCHGPFGYGDGPAAASLAVKPANLSEHFFHHREGDILWLLQHGIAGTPMPGFGDRIGEDGLWKLITFMRAQAEAEKGKAINDSVEPWRRVVAPDFTFQIDRGKQESLAQLRGHNVVLLVFYTLPESLPRLRALAEAKGTLHRAGVRVLAVPMAETPIALRGVPGIDASILADPDSRVVAAYTMFSRTGEVQRVPRVPEHIEFLIDRQGYLRARWAPSGTRGWHRIPELLREVSILTHEKPRSLEAQIHMH